MRKITFILAALFICLLCGWNGETVSAHSRISPEPCLTLDRSVADAWVCEQEYNSDLGLPRIAAEASPASLTPPLLRYVPCFLRLGVKCGVVCGREGGAVNATFEFQTSSIFAGPCAVEYYVYRLRRLII